MTKGQHALSHLLLGSMLVLLPVAARGGDKIAICHLPPGNPENSRTISVDAAALTAHLDHGDQIGECGASCAENGVGCTSNDQCCSGNCADGECAPACTLDGGVCSSASECCGGLCSDQGFCASQCTLGPELDEPPCEFSLPCCPGSGVCVGGFCWADSVTCSLLNEPCNDVAGEVCCFDYVCREGVCVEP